MKQSSSFRGRPRGRNNNYRSNNNNNRNNNRTSFDSSSQVGKIKGNASQVMDKYLLAAKEALSRGERLLAEQCLQYAEHYYRVQNQINNNQNKVKDNNVSADSAQKETISLIAEPEKIETQTPEIKKVEPQEEKPKKVQRTKKASFAKAPKDAEIATPKTLGEMLPKTPESKTQDKDVDLNFSWDPSDIDKKASAKEAEAIN